MKSLITTFLLLTATVITSAQTIVPDSALISGNWTVSGSPYIITGDVKIPYGQVLVIDPGVEIRFASDTSLNDPAIWDMDTNIIGSMRVEGKLVANGTANDTIKFIANSAGYWGGVSFKSGADSTSALSFCRFDHMNEFTWHDSTASDETFGLDIKRKGTLYILNSAFSNNIYSTFIQPLGSKAYIINCHFLNNLESVPYLNPLVPSYLCETHFINSVFDNSTAKGVYMTFQGCIFLNNTSYALYLLDSFVPTRFKVINCLAYNNQTLFCVRGASYLDIYNSIFLNNIKYDSVQTTGWQAKVINNCIFDGSITLTNWSTTSINYTNSNPNLINPQPTNGDFHLTPASICINNGDTAGISTLVPATDLDGNPRYNGAIDIGPYEYQGVLSIGAAAQNNLGTNIYPNPNNGRMTIEYSLNEDATLDITDTNGKLVGRYSLSAKENMQVIASDRFENGVYFYRVAGSTSFNKTGKIIIVK